MTTIRQIINDNTTFTGFLSDGSYLNPEKLVSSSLEDNATSLRLLTIWTVSPDSSVIMMLLLRVELPLCDVDWRTRVANGFPVL